MRAWEGSTVQNAHILLWMGFLKGIGFLNDLFYERSHIAGPGEVSIAFPLDEKRDVVPGGSGGERSVRALKVPYRAARSNSERGA